jgi:hypothetical protein
MRVIATAVNLGHTVTCSSSDGVHAVAPHDRAHAGEQPALRHRIFFTRLCGGGMIDACESIPASA